MFNISGLNKVQLSRIEKGTTAPSFTSVEKITKALGVSASELSVTTDEIEEVNFNDMRNADFHFRFDIWISLSLAK